MNSRPKLLLLASLVSAALACSACGGGRRELRAADTAAPAQVLAQSAADGVARGTFTPFIAPGAGLELASGSISEKSDGRKYEIEFAFPLLKGRVSRLAGRFNRTVMELAEREVNDFKRAYVGTEPGWEGLSDSLLGKYETVHFTEELISLRFSTYAYGRGGRTVRQQFSLNYDLKSGRVIEFGDLFSPGAEHLQAVASYCAAELKRRDTVERGREAERLRGLGVPAPHAAVTADHFIDSGAAPEAENYRAWNLTAEGILVSFAPCQVDACAAGEKEVLVPYSALGPVLNPDGIAARLDARRPR